MAIFKDRRTAGKALAKKLSNFANRDDVIVLGLPRGGIPVAYEVSRSLNAPLDVFIVKKLGAPGQEELAIGAIASGGVCILNSFIIESLSVSDIAVKQAKQKGLEELTRREFSYRRGMPPLSLSKKTVILVDDGLATGATMKAAIKGINYFKPAFVVVAAPVASAGTCEELRSSFGHTTCVCALQPENFHSVGMWYQNFDQTTDEEVCMLLAQRRAEIQKNDDDKHSLEESVG